VKVEITTAAELSQVHVWQKTVGRNILFQEVLKKVASDFPATENLQLISRSLPRPPFDVL
jgi:hypothetical protein